MSKLICVHVYHIIYQVTMCMNMEWIPSRIGLKSICIGNNKSDQIWINVYHVINQEIHDEYNIHAYVAATQWTY